MIIGKTKDIENYPFCPEMKAICDYLKETDLTRLSYGSYNVLENVCIRVLTEECKDAPKFIGHEKRIEIHILTDGEAFYEYSDFSDESIRMEEPYDEESDSGVYDGIVRGRFLLDNSMFIVVFPDDIIRYEIKKERDTISKVVFEIPLKK